LYLCFGFDYAKIQKNTEMATIYLTLSAKTDTNPHKAVRIRFKHGGKIDQQATTNIFVPAEHWDTKNQKIEIPNFRKRFEKQEELIAFLADQQNKLDNLKKSITDLFNETDKSNIANDWLKVEVDKILFPEKYAPIVEKPATLFQFIQNFIDTAPTRKDKKTGRLLSHTENMTFVNTGERVSFGSLKTTEDDKEKYKLIKDLHDAGETYEEIAPKVGYAGKGGVSKFVNKFEKNNNISTSKNENLEEDED
jgi:hypothetical protein